jgi:uncharacterized protein
MRCGYCFYADEASKRNVAFYGHMNVSILRLIVEMALAKAKSECTFAFQGGEPTLAGLKFYQTLVKTVQEKNYKKIPIHYAIQTNGLTLNREWISFFIENNFLIGLSLDGNKEIHDSHRRERTGKGTYSNVMRAAQLLKSSEAEFNILTVVTAQLAKNITKIYGFYLRNNFLYQQYIPCLEQIGEQRGQYDYSLTPRVYGEFLCDLFGLWYNSITNGKAVYIRWFNNLVYILRGFLPEHCGMTGRCGKYYAVEADGSVYPCDFYVLDEYRLGYISDGFEALDQKRADLRFIERSLHIDSACKNCRWFTLCRGGCRRDRDEFVDGVLPINYYCEAFKFFFERCYERLKYIAINLR